MVYVPNTEPVDLAAAEELAKHMTGKHDQSAHAGGGAKSGGSSSSSDARSQEKADFESKYKSLLSEAGQASSENRYIVNSHGLEPSTMGKRISNKGFISHLQIADTLNDTNRERRAKTFMDNKVKSGELVKADFGPLASAGWGAGQRRSGVWYIPSNLVDANTVYIGDENGATTWKITRN